MNDVTGMGQIDKAVEKNKCYGQIDQHLGQYENIMFLADMKISNGMYFGQDADINFIAKMKREHGLVALKDLVACYVTEERVEDVYLHVVQCYDEEWRRYVRDKEAGLVNSGTEDYRNYSWRGNGPRPYFENMIAAYMKKKKYRSIDDL